MEIISDRYELRKEIRRGGFGVTWYGWDKSLDMPVAIKEFSDPDPDHRSKFLREARTLAQFSGCRGIVNVRDFLQTQDKVYMVMEYLDGEDLSTYVDKKGRLSFAETMRLLNPVMDVLMKLHAADMLHRDVSPDNIRLTGDGEVKLLDFGSAASMTSENLTRTITVKPGYAPIEQYSGAAQQGPWTDVYSLCATIYKCITGRKPADSLVRSFHDEVEMPSALGADLSPEEEKVLMKGFSIQPINRYATIGALREALENAKKTAGSEQGNRRTEDLAALAFSDEIDPVPAPVNATRAEDQRYAGPNAGTASEAPAGSAGSGNKPAGRTVFGKKPAENTVSDKKPAEQKSAAEAGTKKKKIGVIVPAVLGLLLIAGMAAFILRGNGGGGGGIPLVTGGVPENASYTSGNSYISFKDKEITQQDLDFINSQEKINNVSFYSCQLSDDMIGGMKELTRVDTVLFYSCEGFSSLDPLAEMPALKAISLSVNREKKLEGDTLFTKDFPQQVTTLDIDAEDISGSTEFMRHFTGLTRLTFDIAADGKDMSFLDAMPGLVYLYIRCQSMDEEDCSHLSGHPDLQRATFEESRMANLDWAKECSQLYHLEAANSLITDLTPLADHQDLQNVYLSGAPVSDLSPLASCPNLTALIIDHSEVESLAPLAGHKKLSKLDIGYCHVSDLSPLSDDTALSSLAAAKNQITTLTPLATCTQLESINVNGNELSDLEGCEELIKLISLFAADNHISSIDAIRNCALLATIQLSNNEISDISAINNDFTQLTLIDITDNEVSDLSALASCAKLSAIAAANNRITSLRGLENKPELMAVLISGNSVSDLSPLKGSLTKLSYLDIGNNQVSSISILKDLSVKNIWLLMENNKISDLSVLPELLSYQDLIFYGNPIKDASFAKEMKNAYFTCDLYLTYHSSIDYKSIGESAFQSNTFLVDVPADKKASVLKSFLEGSSFREPTFMTAEQADIEMAQTRMEIRQKIVGDTMEKEEEASN